MSGLEANAGTAAQARARRRTVIFLLSPRVIDFDTFLPTALELKTAHPTWDLHFVTFAPRNADFIGRDDTFRAGIAACGTFHCLGSGRGTGRMARLWRRATGFAQLAAWLLRDKAPILFAARPFGEMPYNLLYALAHLRGGRGLLLWKSRSADRVHDIVWRNREQPAARPMALFNRLFRHDVDGVVHYHGQQAETIGLSDRFGRIDGVPWRKIGMPHLLPAWRRLIDDQLAVERERLGVADDTELYCMFAAKPYSAVNLGSEDAIERVFRQALVALCKARPKALVLIRPHPLALDEPYIADAIAAVGAERARISFIHPDVMLTMCRRAIFNNPSNIMFTCYRGRIIDVSDYPASHYEEAGDVSLAHGFGPLYLRPDRDDFEEAFAALLDNDEAFDAPEATFARDALLRDSPANLAPLLSLIETGAGNG